MTTNVILTVVGSDRPGLTGTLADAVLGAGGNWLESHLARLGGKYVGSVLVELPAERLPALGDAVRAIDAAGLTVTIVEAGATAPVAGHALNLEVVGQDRPGIVREVTAALATLGVNIDEFSSNAEHGSWSGERLFRAEAVLSVPDAVGSDAVRDALERISGDIMVDFSVSAGG